MFIQRDYATSSRHCIIIHNFINFITSREMIKNAIKVCRFFLCKINNKMQKSPHTCEEGGAHLRISVWHLLLNLKNNYLLKKLLKCVNKKCKYFNV